MRIGIYKPGRADKYDPAKDNKDELPSTPGIYWTRNKENGERLYQGETNNIHRRIQEHIHSGKITGNHTVEYKEANINSTSDERREHERQKIRQHHPPQNKSSGGEGRIAKKSN